MRLSEIATISTNLPNADFWLVRRGSLNDCGKVVRVFNPEHIGIKVHRLDLLLPDYLYYVLMNLHQTGQWEPLTHGSLKLVNIRVSDVQSIELSPV